MECVALKAITVASIVLLQKPHRLSKAKEHTSCLDRRLKLWKDGDLAELIREGKTLQQRLPKLKKYQETDEHLAQSFSNFMFEGKTKAALRLLSNQDRGGVLHLTDSVPHNGQSTTVLEVLKSKHPLGQPVYANYIVSAGETTDVHPIIFDNIDAAMIRAAALRTTGSAGPSGIDAEGEGDSVQLSR